MSFVERGAAPLAGTVKAAEDERRSAWSAALLALGLGLAGFAALFTEEAAAAVRLWDESTAYNHCWLVLPIAAWLAWGRRQRLEGLSPAPSPALALLVLPAVLAWFAAERMGIMEGRQFAAVAAFWALALAVLGWGVCRAMAAPLLYLVFLVPSGAFLVPLLQRITVRFIEVGLGLTSIPHYVDDLVIEIPAGTFLVAEACAGLRFLVAAVAFGALYAIVMFRSPWRRLAVMALALAVPVAANGVRALGLVLLGHHQGSAAAVEADHVLYGWAFFSIVILLMVLAGLPFRQDHAVATPHGWRGDAPVPRVAAAAAAGRGTSCGRRALPAAALAVGLAAAGPGLASMLAGADGTPEAAVPRLVPPEGCDADGSVLRCPGVVFSARLLVFPPHVTWRSVAAERRRMAAGGDQDVTFGVFPPAGAAEWQARLWHDRPGGVAVAAWLDERPAGDGLRSRASQAWGAVRGSRPVLAAVEMAPGGSGAEAGASRTRERDLLRMVLEAQDRGLAAQGAALSKAAR